jgi:hypothetical protein
MATGDVHTSTDDGGRQDRRKPSRFHKNIKEAQAVGQEMARRRGVEHFIDPTRTPG